MYHTVVPIPSHSQSHTLPLQGDMGMQGPDGDKGEMGSGGEKGMKVCHSMVFTLHQFH